MSRFTQWWNRNKIKERLNNDRLQLIETKVLELTNTNLVLADELSVYKSNELDNEAKRTGDIPWVEITSDSYDKIKGIKIALDWNDAFIDYLIANGINGTDEETIVQKWLALLYDDLLVKMETQSIDNSDIMGTSDFE
jgi:hypothetical protein